MAIDDSDATLAIAARRGDQQAFVLLVERYRPMVRTLCQRMLGDSVLAEDAVQEATLRAFLSLSYLRRPERFGSWLAGIGLNVCRLWLRERTRNYWSWEELAGGRYVAEPLDERADSEELAEAADLAECVRRAVADLPPGQRAVVVLFYLSGLSYAETAAQLGIEVNAVRVRLHKARQTLKQQLQSIWEEERVAANQSTNFVEMRVADVRRLRAEEGKPSKYVVVLEEVNGTRTLPIWVGKFEGEALALNLKNVQPPRPGPYHFGASLFQGIGGRLQEVQITKLVDTTFYATAILVGPGGTAAVDARPSDALNLALVTNAPIRVEPAVLEAAVQAVIPKEHQPLAESEAGAEEIVSEVTAGWQKPPA